VVLPRQRGRRAFRNSWIRPRRFYIRQPAAYCGMVGLKTDLRPGEHKGRPFRCHGISIHCRPNHATCGGCGDQCSDDRRL